MKTSTIIAIVVVLGLGGLIAWGLMGGKDPETTQVKSFVECEAAGYPVAESHPRQCRTPDGTLFVEEIENGDNGNGSEDKSDLIRVTEPVANTEIGSPLTIKGEARGYWFFEASFPVKLIDAEGNDVPLDPPYMMATEEWMTEEFVLFEDTFTFTPPATETGTLILQKDNPSGLPENDDELRIPVRFSEISAEMMEVKVFFSNPKLDPKAELDCAVMAESVRRVPKTTQTARAALEELLKGTTRAEREAGYVTAIPTGVKIQSLSITNGVAKVDFSKELEPGGGSCAVTAIRAQIEKTFRQFSTVKSVAISIDGKSGDDILQP
jgi:hypothetical protein